MWRGKLLNLITRRSEACGQVTEEEMKGCFERVLAIVEKKLLRFNERFCGC